LTSTAVAWMWYNNVLPGKTGGHNNGNAHGAE
jgi:hypothetical protein